MTDIDVIKIGLQKMFSDGFISEPSVDVVRMFGDTHAFFISGKVYGQRNMKEYSFKYPSDWWQAVKERFAPAWYLKKSPVKYTVHEISVDAVYPELSKRLKLPKEQHRLILSSFTHDEDK